MINGAQKGMRVTVIIAGREYKGMIKRKQGAHGYMVEYMDTTTSQDFATGKLTEHQVCRTNYFKSKDIYYVIPDEERSLSMAQRFL